MLYELQNEGRKWNVANQTEKRKLLSCAKASKASTVKKKKKRERETERHKML